MSEKHYNEQQNTFSNHSIERLEGYIDTLKARYKVNFNLHDLSGISKLDDSLEKALTPYLYHNNCFCNFIKSHPLSFARCIMNKKNLCNYCEKNSSPFYGKCYMGVYEFVFPIRVDGEMVAVLCAGQFYNNLGHSLKRLEEISVRHDINYKACEEKFLDTARKVDFSINDFSNDINMLTEIIALYYKVYFYDKAKLSGMKLKEAEYKNNFIVDNTIRFIAQNYNKELTLQILALNSYCNRSYLSSIFKKKTGLNLTDYINRVRIVNSKELLNNTLLSITRIAGLVGFNDSCYFARVFKQQNGVSPSEYRESLTS